MPHTRRRAPPTRRRYMRRLSRSGAGWTLGEMIMPALVFSGIVVALAMIIYEIEVYLPEHQGDQNTAPPAIVHQTHPPL